MQAYGVPCADSPPPHHRPRGEQPCAASAAALSIVARTAIPGTSSSRSTAGSNGAAGTSSREEAIAFLQRRLDEATHGRYTDIDQRPTFADLERLLLENYEFKRNRTDPRRHVRRLAEMFGEMKAEEITEARIREYSQKRLKQDGMTPGTLRRELALLKRMLRLGCTISAVPRCAT